MSESQSRLSVGTPGASASAEAARRRAARIRRRREQLGMLGAGLAMLSDPPRERAWRTGAEGERRTAARLTRLLRGTPVLLLHDLRIPRSRANIDHLAVGPGGVTVIDAKNHAGKVHTERRGLIGPTTEHLLIGGRDRTALIRGVERQVEAVERALEDLGLPGLEVRGCVCMVDAGGLPLLSRLQVRRVPVAGARGSARLAARPGRLTAPRVERVAHSLVMLFAPAGR